MTEPVFDSYVMVDWSASSRRSPAKPSPDAIWWAVGRRGPDGAVTVETPVYERARADAMDSLRCLLIAERAAGRRILMGFDFAFGYPRGFAARLTGEDRALAVWEWLAREAVDEPDNANNRFEVAARVNALFDGTGPFWGRPNGWDVPGLPARGSERSGTDHPPERRLVEETEQSAQPVWKLYTTGSVGSQVLLGLLALQRLRSDPDLGPEIGVWPLETGLECPSQPIVLAEIYPSMIPPDPSEEIKDAGQVKAVVKAYSRLDGQGGLAPLFLGPWSLDAAERRIIAREEAWILGAGASDQLINGRPESGLAPAATAGPEPRSLTYLRDPAQIYRESFATVRAEARLDHLPPDLSDIAIRLIHACGMPEISARLAWSAGVGQAARTALQGGAPVLCDCEAVASGIIRARLPAGNRVICTLNERETPGLAKSIGNTRSAAAVELWRQHLPGAVVAIGNAPTALFHLLELIDSGWPKPAAILGFPVGFVGAAESKAELAEARRSVEFLTLRGRRGGSAMASAAVNAFAAGLETPS